MRSRGGNWVDSIVRVTPNSHLHFALVLALGLAALVALATPISRSAASSNPPAALPDVSAVSQGLAESIRGQAAAVTAAVAGHPGGIEASEPTFGKATAALIAAKLLPAPLLEMTGRLMASSALSSPGISPVLALASSTYFSFEVHQDGMSSSYFSSAPTVGRALADAGVRIGERDIVFPDAESAMKPGLHIYVQHATSVTLALAGTEIGIHTYASTVGELLAERQIVPEQMDEVDPGMDEGLIDGMRVTVTTLREGTEFAETTIPYRTVYRYDSGMYEGEQALIQGGENGNLRREYFVTRLNGEKVLSEIVSATLTLPIEQVIAVGTYVPPPAPTPPVSAATSDPGGEIECAQTLRVWATWYTAATSGGSGITKTGTPVYKGIIATDPSVIPLGTEMYVPGYGFGTAADTGGGIIGNMIDLGYGPNDIVGWRTGYVDICIIG